MLSGEIARQQGSAGLPDDTIRVLFTGSAGQSFGAFLARGVTLSLEGDANDYVGKGLSGGKLIVYPPELSTSPREEWTVVGNVALYGAIAGQAFFRGKAGERFAVRNSGATAVVEGVGDHGCEYMTNGVIVVLGKTRKNFAAGMSGGLAYVFDETGDFASLLCNRDMVSVDPLEPDDDATVRRLVQSHAVLTRSPRAAAMLDRWQEVVSKFVKVFPHDYRRILSERAATAHGAAKRREEAAIG